MKQNIPLLTGSKKQKAELLKDLFKGKLSLTEILNPSPEYVILYDARAKFKNPCVEKGYFYAGPPDMEKDVNGITSPEQLEKYQLKHPSTKVICFVMQDGNEPLKEDNENI